MTKPQKRSSAKQRDYIPVTVPFAAIPAGETPGIDQWAHQAVWTDRMLATLLENRVRGGSGVGRMPTLRSMGSSA
jgi:hypothetical protein